MYQALYRKWRPRSFDDVVGQEHITETLKRQVAAGRPSHAYLFTGTRGTGKTTCAKILARAVNCENPQNGNPCNMCPSCLGIENGSILDVLELDGASNNGVEHVRALRDEAVYTPASVRKRVYIIDEVHMMSQPAFNALLKIMEEPPEHVMFILATTEVHKVPATIKSRCQQYSFKRIQPDQIAQRLGYISMQEGIALTAQGASLLARLADGGMRDALSLLDQCSGGSGEVDEERILETLGLAGNVETAALMEKIVLRDTAGALEKFGQMYASGKDVGAVLGELSALARDLLLQKTAPKGGAALMTGGYDKATMRSLGDRFTPQRLMQILSTLQSAIADLARSSSRRTDGELCLIRLSDETLDESATGLAARIARLEEMLAQPAPSRVPSAVQSPQPADGPPVRPAAPVQSPPSVRPVARMPDPQTSGVPPVRATAPVQRPEPPQDPAPPWDDEGAPMPEEPPEMEERDYSLEEEAPAPQPIAPAPDSPPLSPAPAPEQVRPVRNARPVSTPVPTGASATFSPASGESRGPIRRDVCVPGRPVQWGEGDRTFWPDFVKRIRKKQINPVLLTVLDNPNRIGGIWNRGTLTIWVTEDFVRNIIGTNYNRIKFEEVAQEMFQVKAVIQVVTGCPPEPEAKPEPERDMMDDLMQFSAYDNISVE